MSHPCSIWTTSENENDFCLRFFSAAKMLCGVTLSQMKRHKSRKKTAGLSQGDAPYLKVKACSCDVTPSLIDKCSARDVTETENCATVADVAPRSCNLRLELSSFDAQLHLTGGEISQISISDVCSK